MIVPLRKVLKECRVLTGEVSAVEHEQKVATIAPPEGKPFELRYDVLVMVSGSLSRTLPIPGLAKVGISFKTAGEAIRLRNHVLSRLDLASSTDDPQRRREALTFVFVGGAGTPESRRLLNSRIWPVREVLEFGSGNNASHVK